MTQLLEIAGDVRDYDWGSVGGISMALGRPFTEAIEAELWLGAHPSLPSRILTVDAAYADLAEWERDGHGPVPFLLKVLAAASPLSLQAHPTPSQAAVGFARENAAGVPLDARERSYKDSSAKPELIVALKDGFEALCGFRPLTETRAAVLELAQLAPDAAPFLEWEARLAGNAGGLRGVFEWLLANGPTVRSIVAQIVVVASTVEDDRWELQGRLAAKYPEDPGVAVALMLNHVTLAKGDALWLPAGNIHAYLRGVGVELMGPSDNVLRGGLTSKHVDRDELSRVLDFSDIVPPLLASTSVSDGIRSYRPPTTTTGGQVEFQLYDISGPGSLRTASPAIGLVVAGSFSVHADQNAAHLDSGQAVLVTHPADLRIEGDGTLFLASR
ncbi:mannose-6-phosphate isomerase, class I [Microbacterium chocolatum]|uniref:mannose-6-phosphate isomerase, class I n=1 Tax=Microbacterium aurantiacum TaxID=162393 RepID=UPI00338DE8EC